MNRSPLAGVGGAWLCGALMVGVGAAAVLPAWGQSATQQQASSAELRDARLAYEAGLLLHEQGEYEAAIHVYIESIAADPSQDAVYRALTAAQVAGAEQRLERAIHAADAGDLPTAARHARRAAELDGENEDAVTAARSLSDASAVLSASQYHRYAHGQALTEDRQWGLAKREFAGLVDELPLYLPARAAQHRAAYFEGRANTMANEGVALMQQHRLTPAVEQLSGAVAIWPYHPDAVASLEQAQAGAERAADLADEAQAALSRQESKRALGLAQEALAIDRSNVVGRSVEHNALRRLADLAVAAGRGDMAVDDFLAARAHYVEALQLVRGYPDARRGMAQSYFAQSSALLDDGRPGASLLAYLAGQTHQRRMSRWALGQAEQRVLTQTDLSMALSVPEHAPAIGVGSDVLLAELRSQRRPNYFTNTDTPRYLVNVAITNTDITLRRIRTPGASYLYPEGYATSVSQWEKRGTLDCTITLSERETGAVVRRWSASRWVTFSDTQQYVIGSTWRQSYWTLPTDDAVAARLARDMAEAVWPDVIDRLALDRARELRDRAASPSLEDSPESLLELRVAATLLAGQVNEREGEQALRAMAREFAGDAAE